MLLYATSLLLFAAVANHGSCSIYGSTEEGRVQAVTVGQSSDTPTLAKRLRRQTDGPGVVVKRNYLGGSTHDQILVHWVGHPSPVLFVLTRRRDPATGRSLESWLWRSSDNGNTIQNETSKLGDNALIEWYYISPDGSKLIFTDIIHHALHITTDEGHTYTRHEVPFVPDKLVFQKQTIPNSQSDVVLGYDSSAQSLYVSDTLGMTSSWIALYLGNVTRYFWRELGPPYDNYTTVYFEVDLGNNTAVLKRSSSPFLAVEDFPQLGTFLPNSFYLTLQYMFVRRHATIGSSPLWVSFRRGPFQQALFPGLLPPEMYYMVVDASEDQVFMVVYHNANTSSLYVSDETGRIYSLSLEHVVSSDVSTWMAGDPKVDVHPVEGLHGTYLANIVDSENSSFGSTVITFNKGGAWQRLAPPTGSSTTCSMPNCSLHLRMDSDVVNGYQSILSQDSAIGLIMAVGNIGPSLISDPSSVGLYFSHDGGNTWQLVTNGYWEFQFIGQGSIIVAIAKSTTEVLLWSCDDGYNWNSTNLTTPISVMGMLTEPGEMALHASVFGYSGKWVLIDLDFRSVANTCSQSQYSPWQQSNQRGDPVCVLGEMVVYQRRSLGVCCLVDQNHTLRINMSSCLCSVDDFECDVGFERPILDGPCVPMEGYKYPPPPPTNCPYGTNYSYTSGYRRISGDRCIATDRDLSQPVEVPCPNNSSNICSSLPGTSTAVPGTSTLDPGTSTSVPGTSTPVPGTSTSAPGTTSGPGTSTSVPGTSTSVPGTSTSAPGTSTSVPGTSISVPGTSTSVPDTSTPVPGTSTGTTSVPGTSTPVPGTTSVPGTSTSVRGTSTSVPGTSTSVPGTSTSVPGTSTSVPDTSTSVPGTSTSVPDTSTPVPGTSTLVPGTTSVPGTSTPVSGTTSVPGTSISVPGTSTSVPGTSIPVSGTTSVPGTSTSVPGTSTSVPGTITSFPGTDRFVPGALIPATSSSSANIRSIIFAPASTSIPRTSTVPTNDSLRLTIGLGAGIPLLLLVVVVMAIIIVAFAYCKRRYDHSQVGYLRVLQSPLDDKVWIRKETMEMDPCVKEEVEEEEEEGDEEVQKEGRELVINDNGGIELKEIRSHNRFAFHQPTIPDIGYDSLL